MQCLCAVVDAAFNTSDAAAALHATQPAISKQLREFERELGVELLVRRGARIVGLTDAGEHALKWSRQALQSAANILAFGEDKSGALAGSIVLATTHTHARYLLLDAIKTYRQRFPGISVNVLHGTPDGVAEIVQRGEADIGVASQTTEAPAHLISVPVSTQSYVVVAPRAHPILRAKQLTLEQLARYPLIAAPPSRPHGARLQRRFQEAGLAPQIVVQALDSDVMKAYVQAGMGIAIILDVAYSPSTDVDLRTRDVSHLFEANTSVALLRRNALLKRAAFEFLAVLLPGRSRRQLEALVSAGA